MYTKDTASVFLEKQDYQPNT